MIAVKTSTRSPGSARRRPGPSSVVATVSLVGQTGVDRRALTDRHRLVGDERDQVAAEANGDDRHARQVDVHQRERDQEAPADGDERRRRALVADPRQDRARRVPPRRLARRARTDARMARQRPPATSPTRIPPTSIATGNHMSCSRYFRPRDRTGIAQATTTTCVPTPAKLHIFAASPTLWRTHPLLR